MNCKDCGKEMAPDQMFCTACGSPVAQESQSPKQKAQMSQKGKIILMLSSIGAVLVVGVILAILILTNPMSVFKNSVESNDYVKATEVYENYLSGDAKQRLDIYDYLSEKINQVKEDFYANEIDFETAMQRFTTIQNLFIIDEAELEIILSALDILNSSHTAFKTGEEYFNNKKYHEAIVQLKNVIADDKDYKNAQAQLSTAIGLLKDDILKQTDSLQANGKFDEAINLINTGLGVLPKDADLTSRLTVLKTAKKDAHKQEELTKATDFAAQGDYASAFRILDVLIADMPDDTEIQNKKNEIMSSYINSVLAQADELIAAQNYTEAVKILNSGLALLPDNADFQAKLNYTNEFFPIKMKDMAKLSTDISVGTIGTYLWEYHDVFTTNMGKAYNDCFVNCSSSAEDGIFYSKFKIVFAPNAQFARFVTEIGVGEAATKDRQQSVGKFYFYADGVLVYKSGYIDSQLQEPIKVDIDLAGVKEFRIEGSGFNIKYGVALLSPMFYKH